jgi:predicted ester cyclase
MTNITEIYREYIACLNKRGLTELGRFVQDDVLYNARQIGLAGYTGMLEQNFAEIPDLYFNIQLLMSDESYVACRLNFDCTPTGSFLDQKDC